MKKSNGKWTVEDEEVSEEEAGGSPRIDSKDEAGKTEKKMQNGQIGNFVIARSKDLILLPEPEMQNHNNQEEEEKETTEKRDTHLSATKEVTAILFQDNHT